MSDLTELMPLLECPVCRSPLKIEEDRLVDGHALHSYPIIDGIPDLRAAPARLTIDLPWYEPWQDLDGLKIAYPDRSSEKSLPYHLDAYLAGFFPVVDQQELVLEIGCGERQCEDWLTSRGYRYIGLDVDIRGPGPNVLADGHNLPIQSGSIDVCTSMAVMEHLVSPMTFAQEIYRVLKPGGMFVGSSAFMFGYHDRASFHHMSHAGLLYVFRACGFEVIQMWPDWRYQESISYWPYRGVVGLPWKHVARAGLELTEWTFRKASNLARRVANKTPIDAIRRDIEMAGSISFQILKPSN